MSELAEKPQDDAHARFAPSAAHRWMRCPGSWGLERTVERRSSVYADEGKAAHALAAIILKDNMSRDDALALIGTAKLEIEPGQEWPITEDMVDHVCKYTKLAREYAEGGQLLVEQKVNYGPLVGLQHNEGWGTSDAVAIHPTRLVVVDLKYGMGVQVDAYENEQLLLYAAGAYYEFMPLLDDITEVVMVIHQPRLNHVSEYVIPLADLQAFLPKVAAAIVATQEAEPKFEPGDKQCRFCDAKAGCPALRDDVFTTAATVADFEELPKDKQLPKGAEATDLSYAMSKVKLIEDWCTAIRAEVERRLLAGEPVAGFKLVEGRLGNRAWKDADAVEKTLKGWKFRKDEMFDYTLLSPTSAEKLLAGAPARWEKLQELIHRAPGKPSVAPATDKREAYSQAAPASDFVD